MTHASVFSGIGGPEVAATMLGWQNLFHCEINPFGRRVLDYWFPDSESYEDITKTDFSKWQGRVNVLTGGFPCQPFSYAGKRGGAEDDRYLWPYMHKCINQIKPDWVVCENVAGIATMVEQGEVSEMESTGNLFATDNVLRRYRLQETFTLERICNDIEADGYEVQAVLIPACSVGAPHRRDRVFIIGRRIDTVSKDTLHVRCSERQNGKQRCKRNVGNSCPGDNEWLCRETSWSENFYRLIADSRSGGQCSPEIKGKRSRKKVQQQSREQSQYGACGQGDTHAAADTSRRGISGFDDNSQQCDEGVVGQSLQDCKPNSSGNKQGWNADAADTDNAGFQETRPEQSAAMSGRTDLRNGKRNKIDEGGTGEAGCGRWTNFPTVSPVHRGNDGLPFDVDSLTISFAKWRTEALKAYGNAIVPQVMYEIFRAIEIVSKM